MSEKYGTEELVLWVKLAVARLVVGEKRKDINVEDEVRDAIIAKLRAGDVIEEKYNELLYEVARKFPGETRHETARRYIREAETRRDTGAQQAIAEFKGKK